MSRMKKFTAYVLVVVMAVSILPVTNGMKKVEAAGTASDLVSVAASQVGYHEKASNYNLDDFTANSGSANYNKYARDLGVTNGQAWCATFVWWCMKRAGVADSAYPSRTTVTREWFNDRGLYHARGSYTPKAGDYVIFGNVAHCGIVEYVSGSYVHTIEGNSSDQVRRNTYSLTSSYILGYGEISYSGSSVTTDTSNPGSPYPVPTTNIRSGSSGDQVRWVQKFANDVMGAGISVDGVAGTQTVNAIKQFQSQYGLTVDGIAGTQTINKMLEVWKNKVAAATPVNLGTEFCALIIRKDIWKTIRNNADDVVLWDEVVRGDYLWRFVRQSDGSYMIESLYDKTVLDVQAAGTADQTNVITFKDGGRNNQRWYIYNSGNAYKLVPKHAPGMALDVYGAATANGSFVGIYTDNGSAAQQFAIYKYDHQALKSISINTDYDKTMYTGESQTLKYTLNPTNTKSNMVTWSTTNSSVATVDSNGVVKAVGTGKATIKCTSTYDSGIKATVEITVKEKEIPTTEATTERQTTELSTEIPTTEATTEVTTEIPTTEAPAEVTTEAPTEIPTTEVTTEASTEKTTTEAMTETTTRVSTETDKMSSEDKEIEESTTETSPVDLEEDSQDEMVSWNEMSQENDESEGWEETQLPEEKGSILTDSTKKCIVKVTSDAVGNPTVEYLGTTNASAKNVTIPESVTIDEVVYKVTGIADNAFKNCTSLKKITISKYVTKIGKGAFQNCKKLKKITIKSMTLKKIGKNAFKNVNKNAVCQIPKGKKNEYKKMLKKAGLK